MKTIIILISFIILPLGILSQNINGKLGNNGQFIIRDTNTTFLTLSQSNGYLNLNRSFVLLNTTGSTLGVIFKEAERFLHNFQAPGTSGFNTFLGINSGNFTMSGTSSSSSYNTAVGHSTLFSQSTGSYNSAFGYYSMRNNTTGFNNSAFGYNSLTTNTIGISNSAFGIQSLLNSSTGTGNSAFGFQSLVSNTTGNYNSAFGYLSLSSHTTGSNNTALGFNSASNLTTGSNNTAIGYLAQLPSNTASNQVRIGNTSITYAGVQVAWTITSDRKLKSNIQNSNLGLNFITKLRPVSYTRINDEKQNTEYGFISQEVDEILRVESVLNSGIVSVDDEGTYSLRYNDLIAPMVKAIQELKSENDDLKNKNENLEERLLKYEQMQALLLKKMDGIESVKELTKQTIDKGENYAGQKLNHNQKTEK